MADQQLADDTPKEWYKSKTVLGGAVAAIAAVANITGHQLSPEAQNGLLNSLTALGGLAGSILAIYGRFNAVKKVV